MSDQNRENSNGLPAYEPPDVHRPASAAPTEPQLEAQMPGGRDVGRHDPYAALRFRNYRLFASAFLFSVIAGQVQTVTVGWEIYKKTGSALNLGWLGLIMAIPVFVFALPAGHLADTRSRRRIVMATHVISSLCALGLAGVSYYWSAWSWSLPMMYALLLIGNSGATFGRPARSALMPQLVPARVFPNAVTWNSSMFEIASVTGPVLAGFVCHWSIPLAYVISSVCWIGTSLLVYRLPNKTPPPRGAPASLHDLAAGIRYVFRTKLLVGTMTLDLLAVLLGGATFLLPIFAMKLGGGAVTLGWLRTAPAIGACVMAVAIAHMPPFQRAGRALLLAVCGFGVATIVFGFSTSFWLSFGMLILIGAFDNISVVVRHSLVQLLTPDHMRGRVAAVNQIFIGSSNELGGFESGVTAAFFGEVISVAAGGIGTILVVLGVHWTWPQIGQLGSLKDIRPRDSGEDQAVDLTANKSPQPVRIPAGRDARSP